MSREGAERPSAGASTPLIGRERELATLLGGLEAARRGRGHLFLLRGEAGMGKTRLLQTVADAVERRGTLAVWGRCWEGVDAPPLWPWGQILRGVLERDEQASVRLDARVPAGTRPQVAGGAPSLAGEIQTVLRGMASRRPFVLLFDDLHAASEPSLALLEKLACDLWALPIVIVGACRDTDPEGQEIIARLIGLGRDCTEIALPGLDAAASAALVAAVAGRSPTAALSDTLHIATGGSPFLLDEMARVLVADGRIDAARLPSGPLGISLRIRSVLCARLATLPPATRGALDAVAVSGGVVETAVLALALDVPPTTLGAMIRPALAAHLLRTADGAVELTNSLLREAIYGALPDARRIALHCRFGEVLEAGSPVGAADNRLARLAYHFYEGQPAADAARAHSYAEAAARQAYDAEAYEQAALHFEQAVALLDRDLAHSTERAELLLALADSTRRSGDPSRARDVAREAAAAARRANSARLFARAVLLSQPSDSEIDVALLRAALEWLGDGSAPDLHAALKRCATGPVDVDRAFGTVSMPVAVASANRLTHEGEYWSVVYRGSASLLHDRAGLHYLAELLARPNVDVAAIDLVDGADAATRPDRAPTALVARSEAVVERARVRVTRALRLAIAHARRIDRALGDHLVGSIRTGRRCRYAPSEPTVWVVGRTRTADREAE